MTNLDLVNGITREILLCVGLPFGGVVALAGLIMFVADLVDRLRS